jgi:hypothetical protein
MSFVDAPAERAWELKMSFEDKFALSISTNNELSKR